MPKMRAIAKGVVWFENPKRIYQLMVDQCSAMRSAYQAIHKHGLSGNDVKVYVKRNYMDTLNQRYISDAVTRAKGIRHDGAIFGGKKNWRDFNNGKITKEDWEAARNNQLYSRGDRSHTGNANIRISGDKLLVNDPSTRYSWIEGKLFIPKKFNIKLECYDVRLIARTDGQFNVVASWELDVKMTKTVPGSVGIDINPNGIAIAEVDGDGNLMSHTFLTNDRIRFASKNKRDADIMVLAATAVKLASNAKKAIVVETLSFGPRRKGRSFNRMASNFAYRKMLNAIHRRAWRYGVPVVEVNPAFTSKLGLLKYADVYSLNRHTAAAFVIARRGLGITETQTFDDPKPTGKQGRLNLEGRRFSCELSPKAWDWLKEKFLKPKYPSSQDRHPCRAHQHGRRV